MTNRHPLPSVALLSALALVSLVVAGCSGVGGKGADAPSDPASGVTAADLEGRTFLSTMTEGRELVPESRIRIAFTADGLSANAGCNTMGGAFTVEGGTLTTDALAMTEMACPEPLMEQDTWLAGFLQKASVDLAGDTLILASGSERVVMGSEETVVTDLPLEGTDWRLDTIVTGDAASSVPVGIEPTLHVADGQVAIATGCNMGSATVEIRESTIVVGPMMSTKMACDEERGALESTIFTLLTGEVPYVIDGDRLTLGVAPNQLVYRAAQ